MTLRLGRHEFDDDATLMMAIVNRTPDSFFDKGATWAEDKAFERVAQVVERGRRDRRHRRHQGRARRGDRRGGGEGAGRRLRGPGAGGVPVLVISVDTWRASVGDAVCAAGADLLNDAWGGADPELVDVAAAARRRDRLHAHRRRHAAHPALPDRVRRRRRAPRSTTPSPTPSAPSPPASRRGVDGDRPGPRLRQEHLPLPRAHPAARRDGRHRLAGARVAVQQGLRRRDPRPAGR